MTSILEQIRFPLSPAERSSLYWRLGSLGAFCGGEIAKRNFKSLNLVEAFSIGCEESRFDPRLLGTLINLLARKFSEINPFALGMALQYLPTPQTLGVIGAFSKHLDSDPRLKAFLEIVLTGLKKNILLIIK